MGDRPADEAQPTDPSSAASPTHAPPARATALAPHHAICPCGVEIEVRMAGRGWWSKFGWGVFFPLLSLVFYAFCLVLPAAAELPVVAGAAVAAIPLLVLVVVTVVQWVMRHRGWCWLRRSGFFWITAPGVVITELPTLP